MHRRLIYWSKLKALIRKRQRKLSRVNKFRKSYERECISWCMGTIDVFQVFQLHEPQANICFFIYNILNKINIIKRREEKATVTLLWTRNSVMASKLLTYSIRQIRLPWRRKNKPKIVSNFTNSTSFTQSSVALERVQYRNSVLHSITYLCFRHWPIRNEIFCWVYYKK